MVFLNVRKVDSTRANQVEFRDKVMLIYTDLENLKARSSGGERFPDTEEVGGSKPPVPTIQN